MKSCTKTSITIHLSYETMSDPDIVEIGGELGFIWTINPPYGDDLSLRLGLSIRGHLLGISQCCLFIGGEVLYCFKLL